MLAMTIAAALAADPAAVGAGAEPAGAVPDRVTIAERVQDGWRLRAETFVQHNRDALPTVASIRCELRRNGLLLHAYRDAGLAVEVRGHYPEGEEGDEFGYTNVEALEIDRIRFEARWGERGLAWRFTDVDYPKPPPPPEPPPGKLESVAPVMEAISGFLAVRRRGDMHWHHVGVLADALARARRLRIHFRGSTWFHSDTDPLRSVTVPLEGLAPALAWCHETMASPRALLLHPERADEQGARP